MSSAKQSFKRSVAVVGGGPAGLMAAEVLIQGGVRVELYEAMPSVGRKFLVAGKGGLNITHSEPDEIFFTRYGARSAQIKPLLEAFGQEDLRRWVHELGFDTFVGTSGRVFPVNMNAGPLLRAWLHRLKAAGVNLYLKHRWCGWNEDGTLTLVTPSGERAVATNAVVLALGGGSRPALGSNGEWIPLLRQRGVAVAKLKPSNCGFDVGWTDHFRSRFAGHPVKSVTLTFTNSKGDRFHQRGEFIVTSTGIEGSLIYAISARLRDEIEFSGRAEIQLDLAPDRSLEQIVDLLSISRGSRTMASHLRRRVRIKGVKAGLLREFVPKSDYADPIRLAGAIKGLQVRMIAPRPLEEAISSAGGVLFEELNDHLMVRSLPGVFCAGEMLDWEAPTGGYLLTACFASGRMAGLGVLDWLG